MNDALESLREMKREMKTKEYLKLDMWCHFGTAIIRGPDEGKRVEKSRLRTVVNVLTSLYVRLTK